jgi:integrase
MIRTLYKPKRRKNGKLIVSRLYSARIRIDGERQILNVPLHVSDKQVAEEKLRKLVQEREREIHGLLPAKGLRDGANELLSKHLKDFIADLEAKGRNGQYIAEFENRVTLLMAECGWQLPKDVTPDSFVKWRSEHKKAAKTLNEYLASVRSFFNWMTKQGRIAVNPLLVVQKTETRGREVRRRRAYTDNEVRALLKVAGKRRIVYLMAVLTGIRHGELKALRWGDINLSVEKPSVTVRASISKNHRQACLPLHPALASELAAFRPAKAKAGDLVFEGLVPRSSVFKAHLKAAGISKVDSQGRVVDFHSLRHTFCTILHCAGVPQREAMELMRHNDPRLTATTYADASLFSLRGAVERLSSPSVDDTQIDTQKPGPEGLLVSSAVTVEDGAKSEKSPINTGLKSLSGMECHGESKNEKWSERQDSNRDFAGACLRECLQNTHGYCLKQRFRFFAKRTKMHGCAIFLSANVSKYLSKRIYLEPSPAPLTASTNPRN